MAETPVFQVSKTIATPSGVDYDYVVGSAAARAAQAAGYKLECVACVALDAEASSLLAFQRFTQSGCHFYTTDPENESMSGWTAAAASKTAFLGAPATVQVPPLVNLRRFVKSDNPLAHFFTADAVRNPPPAGYVEQAAGHTGWVRPVTRVEFQVAYNGNGLTSGITVTGGNAAGQKIDVDGEPYTMLPDDALVSYGVGNWIGFNKTGTGAWHFSDISAQGPDSASQFEKFTYSDDLKIALMDSNSNQSTVNISYKYTLKIVDETLDKEIPFDPKIINRSPTSPGPYN